MTDFIKNLIGNDVISSIILSLIPLIELKGGIVFARSAGFSFFAALGLCFAGSSAVFFLIFFLLKPILNALKKIKLFSGLSVKIEAYFKKKSEDVLEKKRGKVAKSETFYKKLGVFIFVAIPLPMTGVWTGTAVAVFLDLKFKDAVLPVLLGNAVAGLLISLLAELCLAVWTIAALDYILWGLFALAAVVLLITIIKLVKSKPAGGNQGEKK